MESSRYPPINLCNARAQLGVDEYQRGWEFAEQGRVTGCLWDPDDQSLTGYVRGSRNYLTRVQLSADVSGGWRLALGFCTCPMQMNCQHVAAILISTAGPSTRGVAAAPEWQRSLDVLLPPSSSAPSIPIAIELSLTTSGPAPTLDARLMQPGPRGSWVTSGLTWDKLSTGRRGIHSEAQIHLLRDFSASSGREPDPAGYYAYSYPEAKNISLLNFESAQLWRLLDEARRTGIPLLEAPAHHAMPPYSTGRMCIDITADHRGDLNVTARLQIVGTATESMVEPTAFIGASGHGAVYLEDGLRLARLDPPAPISLQRMALEEPTLVIAAEEVTRFVTEYYPKLYRLAAIVSSDGSFVPPEISGPTLVLRADYRGEHELGLSWEWAYHLGEQDFRIPVFPGTAADYRDHGAEYEIAASIDAPLERFGLRGHRTGRLASGRRMTGLETMHFATELQPLLDGSPGLTVEVFGTPADYREAGSSLVVDVTTDAVPGETDWFDLGVTISVEGQRIPFTTLFTALASGQSHLLLVDGAFFALDKPELVTLRRLIEEARALTDTDNEKPRISRFQAGLFDELAELGVITRQADQWREQVSGLRALQALPAIPEPQGLNADLRPYQADGFAWLATLHRNGLGGILADDMGLGKTLQALAMICHVQQQNSGLPPFLVVAPSSVVANWATEATRFAPDLSTVTITDTLRRARADLDELTTGAQIVVTSYTLFRLDFEAYAGQAWSGLILDEAQHVKNRQSKTYRCARELPAPTKVAITGTPMENNLMELWSLLSITAPGLFPSPTKFADYFAKPIEKKGDQELLALLRRRIKPLVKRRTKELVAADLPAKQEQILDIELPPKHRALYDKRLQRERQRVLGLLDDFQRNRITILGSLTVLRQMALHPGLVDPEHDGLACAKIDILTEQLRDLAAGGHRALVFSQFTRFLGRVRERLAAEGIEYCYLDGRTDNRPKVIQQFKQGSAAVFLISLKAGGVGLNLAEADYCFLLDPWWNPATENQAIDRAHRIGQTRNVMVYRLIARDTIEEKVRALNARKGRLFTSVIDDGNAFSSALTADDIRGLLT